jgi:pyruvate-ferredoxin/flavodoxin oxidoreductase
MPARGDPGEGLRRERPVRRAADVQVDRLQGNEHKGKQFTIQVAPEDCTGCNLCVNVCPAKDRTNPKHKAIDMHPQAPLRATERANYDFFLDLPELPRTTITKIDHKSSQFLEPLFEYSGAVRRMRRDTVPEAAHQLFGDRLLIANATGCSSIYGGNLRRRRTRRIATGAGRHGRTPSSRTTPSSASAFASRSTRTSPPARGLVQQLAPQIGEALAGALLDADQSNEAGIAAQRERVGALRRQLAAQPGAEARRLETLADYLVKKSVWLVGGTDGRTTSATAASTMCWRTARRQRPRSRHRGLLEHRRSAIEGDAARCGREIRSHRQADREKGSRSAGEHVRPRLRRPRRVRRQDGADSPGVSRGGVLSRTVADHRLQPVHRPRIRHGERRSAAEARRVIGRLAAVPVRSAPLVNGEPPLRLDYGPPSTNVADYMRNESRFRVVERADPERYKTFVAESQAAAERRYAVYSQLAGITIPAVAATHDGNGHPDQETEKETP